MTEGTPLTPEEFRQLNRNLMEKILDRAASDPTWKQRLLDDPEAAMKEASFPEAERLREIQASAQAEETEVVGHVRRPSSTLFCHICGPQHTAEI
jgi:hypothetical protein